MRATLTLPLLLTTAWLASACSSLEPNVPTKPLIGYDLVDLSKVDPVKYEQDYEACASIANQDSTNVGKMATNAMGTVADKASMGIMGYRANKDADRSSVLKRCLSGRGYNVLR